jgi:hypothetical protein
LAKTLAAAKVTLTRALGAGTIGTYVLQKSDGWDGPWTDVATVTSLGSTIVAVSENYVRVRLNTLPGPGTFIKVCIDEITPPSVSVAGKGIVGASSCVQMSGLITTYMAAGTCLSPTENPVKQQFLNAVNFGNMQCSASGDIGGGRSIVITGRAGPCGAMAPGALTCTLVGGGGPPSCSSVVMLNIGNGECWALELAPIGGAFVAPVYVNCTIEATFP